jgi:arsenate reductase-like glutaredoxin family protein
MRRLKRLELHTFLEHRGESLEVQIFGIRKSADTRKALRFFSERRIKTHFVDLLERPASLGELRRFAQKFGVTALLDRDSKRFDELGLRYAQLSDERWLEKLSEEPLLLRLPLVRNVNQVVIGADEATWKSWLGR